MVGLVLAVELDALKIGPRNGFTEFIKITLCIGGG